MSSEAILVNGDWRLVLPPLMVSPAVSGKPAAVITDPPYSEQTHEGQPEDRGAIEYQPWTPNDVREFVLFWAANCTGWIGCMTDDILAPAYRNAYREAGMLDFAPVPILQHAPRLTGDGPGSGAVYFMVARPREKRFMSWGSLPPWYEVPRAYGSPIKGSKPLILMEAILRDYSREGDLVCDPCAGWATTLVAARNLKRRSIGAEISKSTFGFAQNRLRAAVSLQLF